MTDTSMDFAGQAVYSMMHQVLFFMVSGFGFRVQSFEFRVLDFGLRV